MRVQFAHGLEGSPAGSKARLFEAHYDACTPHMDTADFESCVDLHASTIATFHPHILVGSSFGGAVALALLQRDLWRGPTLLLAQAGLRYGLPASLPAGVPVWLAHGRQDDIIDIDDSRRLAAAGDPTDVRLIEVEDNHPLHASVASGALLEWIAALTTRRP